MIKNEDLWSLDITIAKLVLPYLKKFREAVGGYPSDLNSLEEWEAILDKMIKAFGLIANEAIFDTAVKNEPIEEGLDLFRKYYFSLWI